MNTIDRSQLIAQIHTQRRAFREDTPARNLPVPVTRPQPETVNVRPSESVLQGLAAAQPRLISESVDTMERGFRRTQLFRQSDGRNFVRNEEVTLTERGMQRTVTQENPSGSTARFEETLDRQADGTFRRTVRHINETGELETKVDEKQSGVHQFILSGGRYSEEAAAETERGTYFDRTV